MKIGVHFRDKRTSFYKDYYDIFQVWGRMLVKYTDNNYDDALYWYNEAATLSTVASSISRMKYYVLQEYCSRKKTSDDMRKIKKNGRVDLWSKVNDRDYIVEAKQIWPLCTDHLDIDRCIKVGMERACDDMQCSKMSDCTNLAILFIAPRVKERGSRDIVIDSIIGHLDAYDAYAYSFPKCFPKAGNGFWYPGVFAVVTVV
jgi:hypothetical protein